jgi:lysozyme family protein
MIFDDAIKVILRHEGGYVNDPDDLGGETNFGITKRRYPDLDIKNLTKERAIELYRRDFWNRYGMDKFPESVRLAHFDMTVNAGPGNSTRVLQRALIQCGQNVYTIQRVVYYFKIVVSRPKNAKFFYGWIRRTLEVMQGK